MWNVMTVAMVFKSTYSRKAESNGIKATAVGADEWASRSGFESRPLPRIVETRYCKEKKREGKVANGGNQRSQAPPMDVVAVGRESSLRRKA